MRILVDSSVWVDYFRGTSDAHGILDLLIEENIVLTNNLILAELVPFLEIQHENECVTLLKTLQRQPMDIDWDDIIRHQLLCLKNGINGIGIPDLLIAQNALQGGFHLMTKDKHFALFAQHTPLKLYRY